MKNKKRLFVEEKWTYFLLLSVPFALIKTGFDLMNSLNVTPFPMGEFLMQTFISLMILVIGVSLFVKMNTYSAWLNPDHPRNIEK